jgi:ClpP class serine protease
MLLVDSPGAGLAGSAELFDELAWLSLEKPTAAYLEDQAYGTALWAATATDTISANAIGQFGSLGVAAVVLDRSQQFANEGVRVHVVAAGEFKGTGIPGTAITDKQLEYLQQRVNEIAAVQRTDIAAGRRLSGAKLDRVMSGEIFVGPSAVAAGLVDRIESFDQAFARLQQRVG